MIPSGPTANLVVGHARLTFAALNALFNAMFRLGDTSEFFPRGFDGCIGKIVVVFQLSLFVSRNRSHPM
jgi:hypothetical protein